jgi:hypothetical protein
MAMHNEVLYETQTYAGYDIYGKYTVSVPEKSKQESSQIHLSNFPNPFSNITTISIDRPLDGPAYLLVYDLQGSKISEIEIKNNDRILFDGSDIPDGVYILFLSHRGRTTSSKMILLK